jgi:hypothetical protein
MVEGQQHSTGRSNVLPVAVRCVCAGGGCPNRQHADCPISRDGVGEISVSQQPALGWRWTTEGKTWEGRGGKKRKKKKDLPEGPSAARGSP